LRSRAPHQSDWEECAQDRPYEGTTDADPGRPETSAFFVSAALDGKLDTLDKDTRIVMQCHHGIRSRQAAERLVMAGFTRVFNLEVKRMRPRAREVLAARPGVS
jgi:rhodanese-related sulfurtransferase